MTNKTLTRKTLVTIKKIQEAIDEMVAPVEREDLANKVDMTYGYVGRVIRGNPKFFKDDEYGIQINEDVEITLLPGERTKSNKELPAEAADEQVRIDNINGIKMDRMADALELIAGNIAAAEKNASSNNNVPVENKDSKPTAPRMRALVEFDEEVKLDAKKQGIGKRDMLQIYNAEVLKSLYATNKNYRTIDIAIIHQVLEYELKNMGKDKNVRDKAFTNDGEWNMKE